MTNRRFRWAVVIAGLLAACNPVVNFFAFHANSSYILAPESLPPATEEVFFEADDRVRLQALLLRHPSSRFLTLYFHGNAGNVYHRLDDFERLRGAGTNVLGLSYRGYAKSRGSPSEAGIYRDGRAAFEYATRVLGFPPQRIFLFGRSLGSAVAIDLAQDRGLAGLILVSPLSSGREQASAMGLGLAKPLAGTAFDNMAKIKRVSGPLLIVHGARDRIVPITMGRRLFEAAPGEKAFHEIEAAGHNDLSSRFRDRYWAPIYDYVRRLSDADRDIGGNPGRPTPH